MTEQTMQAPGLAQLGRYIAPYKRRALTLVFFYALNIAFQIIAPEALSRFIDYVEGGAAPERVIVTILLYLTFMLLQTGAAIRLAYASEALGQRMTDDCRRDVMARFLDICMQHHARWNSGEVMTRLDEDVQGFYRYAHILLLKLTASGILLACVLAVLAMRSALLAGLLLAVSLLSILAFKRIQDRGVAKYERSARAAAAFNGEMKEMIDSAVEIRAFRAEEYAAHRLKRAMKLRFRESFPASLMYGNLWSAATIMQACVLTAALLIGMLLWDRSAITTGTVFLIFTYTELVVGPLQDFRNHMGELQDARAKMRRVAELMAMPVELRGGCGRLPDGAHALEIRDLHFAYGDGEEILRGVNLALAAGEKVAVAGETGCGKSTLAALVARLYEYPRGEILLGGVEIRSLERAHFRDRVAFLAQEPQLIHGTLRENIALFSERAGDAAILRAIADVGLCAWFAKFPHGLDTVLSMGENSLSAGEAQLIAIARLALRDPALVLLDEMTARLDSETEQRVLSAMEALSRGRTVLCIAHRASALAWMDRTVYMEDGMIRAGRGRGACEA